MIGPNTITTTYDRKGMWGLYAGIANRGVIVTTSATVAKTDIGNIAASTMIAMRNSVRGEKSTLTAHLEIGSGVKIVFGQRFMLEL